MNVAEKTLLLKKDIDAVFQSGINKGRELGRYYNLFVQNGLVYHMNFTTATSGSTVTSAASYAPFLVDAKVGITNPWFGSTGFAFGDGYLGVSGTDQTIYTLDGGAGAFLNGKKNVSIELVSECTIPGSRYMFGAGIFYQINSYDLSTRWYGLQLYRADANMDPSAQFLTAHFLKEKVLGIEANTIAVTYDFNDATNANKYVVKAYANGLIADSSGIQTIEAASAGFSSSNAKIVSKGTTINVYAMRVYEKTLSEAEIYQNHFADIATIHRLDITEFAKATPAEKTAVYEAFKEVAVSDTGLQAKLDTLLA